MLVFFDDKQSYKKLWDEHVQNVDMVLKLLEEKQLYANPSKCSFGVQEFEYLGHIISHEGVKVDPKKIKPTMEWIIPKTLNNIRGFLLLIGYYRKFVKNYGQIETPITTLLKNKEFSWTKKETKYFENLKEVMCMAPIMTMPNFTKKHLLWNVISPNMALVKF
jgi:hypothetical protein